MEGWLSTRACQLRAARVAPSQSGRRRRRFNVARGYRDWSCRTAAGAKGAQNKAIRGCSCRESRLVRGLVREGTHDLLPQTDERAELITAQTPATAPPENPISTCACRLRTETGTD